MKDLSIDALQSHSVNSVSFDDVAPLNPKIPFCGRHFNRPRVETSTISPSATLEEYADQLDINNIIRRHEINNIPLPSIDKGLYGIDATVQDYVEKFQVAKNNFMQLPSALRAQFNNDVSQFSSYLSASSDEDVVKTLKKYGLVKDDVVPAVGESTVVTVSEPVETPQPVKEDVSAS